jgi:hypothetical protein
MFLKRLQKVEGLKTLDDKLWNSLQISFDFLELDEKMMLLDVVCFFCNIDDVHGWKGMTYTSALRIWEYLCDTPNIIFANLKDNCFLKVKFGGWIQMHDQVRNMC